MGQLTNSRLMQEIRRQFRLDWQGIHGAPHWARVRFHGVSLARALGADVRIPALFAVLHDSQRENDRYDPGHGERAADYAGWLWAKGYFELEPAALRLLQHACSGHSDGHTEADGSVQVCWDGDRLDLGRVGKRPDPQYLCTEAARDPQRIAQAWAWSRR
jgi:uncharacterized protein